MFWSEVDVVQGIEDGLCEILVAFMVLILFFCSCVFCVCGICVHCEEGVWGGG